MPGPGVKSVCSQWWLKEMLGARLSERLKWQLKLVCGNQVHLDPRK